MPGWRARRGRSCAGSTPEAVSRRSTCARASTYSRRVARLLSSAGHRSRYRRGARSGVSDTVYLGAFRTADLCGVGGWNTALTTNQDFELNRRLAKTGVIWFDGSLPVEYVPRPNLRALYAQYRRFGSWKARYWRLTGDRPR